MITHLEPDILECQVKWALRSIIMNKASGGDGILAELFKILKDEAVKALPSTWQQIWKTQQWPQDWKCQFSFQSQRRAMSKNAQTTAQLCPFHMLSKAMLKILQTRVQQYRNQELPDVEAGFRKGRGTRGQIASIYWIIEKSREFQKNVHFCFTDYANTFHCVDHSHKLGNS